MSVYARPTSENLKNVPSELGQYDSWIVWREESPRSAKSKASKIPVSPKTLRNASTTNADDWVARTDAIDVYIKNEKNLSGPGFVFSENDPFAGVDIDKCRDKKTGVIAAWAERIIRKFDSYTEISPSGTGVKLFIKARLEEKKNHFEVQGHEIEIYDRGRYFAVTGEHLVGTPDNINNCQAVVDELLPNQTSQLSVELPPRGEDRAAKMIDRVEDAELIRRIVRSAQGEKFKALMDGSTVGYAGYFAASGALCTILAAWTRCDAARVDRIYRTSGLYEESWWDDRCYAGRRSRGEVTVSDSCAVASSGWMYDPAAAVSVWDDSEMERIAASAKRMQVYNGAINSDSANAERFIYFYHDRVRYCPASDRWHVWDGRRWKIDDMNKVEALAARTAASVWIEASFADGEKRDVLFDWAKNSAMQGRIRALMSLASAREEIVVAHGQFDSNPWLLNLQNGTFDLKTAIFRDHRKEDLITCIAPSSYDPEVKCKRFESFMDSSMQMDVGMIGWMRRYLGYCLTGDVSEQMFAIFEGPTETGKSTMENIMRLVVGTDYVGSVSAKCLFDPEDRESEIQFARVASCRLVCASEGQEGKHLPEAFIKSITGNEPLVMRRMYAEPVQFIPKFKLILATNFKPSIKETGNAIWRRMQLFPFRHKFAKINTHFAEEIVSEESSGILSWLIKGTKEYLAEKFTDQPDMIREAMENYKNEEDEVAAFVKWHCLKEEAESSTSRELYEAFKKTQMDEGVKEKYVMSPKMFGVKLESLGFKKGPRVGSDKQLTRIGVRLLRPGESVTE